MGVEEKRNIHWVSQKVVMLPYLKGGLVTKNISDFNLAHLNKWGWRIAQGNKSLWMDMLKARYGDLGLRGTCGGDGFKLSYSSFQWSDILKVSLSSLSSNDPIDSNCRFLVANDFNLPFWEVRQLDNFILKEEFMDLYSTSLLKKVSVTAMGGWCGGVWRWGDLGI